MCFSVGLGINALLWFQPSASGKEIVLRPLPLPPHSEQTEISKQNRRLSRSTNSVASKAVLDRQRFQWRSLLSVSLMCCAPVSLNEEPLLS